MDLSDVKADAAKAAAEARVIETALKTDAGFIRTHAKQIAVGAVAVVLFVAILAHLV